MTVFVDGMREFSSMGAISDEAELTETTSSVPSVVGIASSSSIITILIIPMKFVVVVVKIYPKPLFFEQQHAPSNL